MSKTRKKKYLFQKYLFQKKVRKTRKTRKIKKKLNKPSSKTSTPKIQIIKNLQGCNIDVLSKKSQNGKFQINLKIKDEPYKREVKRKFQNWFYFGANSVKDTNVQYTIRDVNNYDNDWKGFNACYSYDNVNWKRVKTIVKTQKKKTNISWKFKSTEDKVWFAYYPPYPFTRVQKLFGKSKIIGRSERGRPIYMEKVGKGDTKVWIICGQHPGETINSWILEGFMEKLEERKSLYKKYTFFVVPCINPDGKEMGHWYTNAKGVNLNRDWLDFKAKETQVVKKQFLKYGFDLVIDLHGDEGANKHFLAHSPKKKHPSHDEINERLNKKNKNFQLKNYYIKNGHNQTLANTLDEFTTGITVEGAMKHKLGKHKTIQDEAKQIGRDLLDSL